MFPYEVKFLDSYLFFCLFKTFLLLDYLAMSMACSVNMLELGKYFSNLSLNNDLIKIQNIHDKIKEFYNSTKLMCK